MMETRTQRERGIYGWLSKRVKINTSKVSRIYRLTMGKGKVPKDQSKQDQKVRNREYEKEKMEVYETC